MGHIKDILIRCDNNMEIAKIAMKLEGAMANPSKRRNIAIWLAKNSQSSINLIKKGETNYE